MSRKNQTTITAEPGKQEILILREFDALRELVFRAYHDPKQLPRWVGCSIFTTTVEKYEVKNGGTWRYVHKDPSGNLHGFHGWFHEVVAPERTIHTHEYEALPEKGHVLLITNRFTELPGGRTLLTIQYLFQSVGDRDGMLQAGATGQFHEAHTELDTILEEMTVRS